MQFLLAVHSNPDEHGEFGPYGSGPEMEQAMADTGRFNQRLADEGVLVFVGGLAPASTASEVDARGTGTPGDDHGATDHLGGFWVVDVADRETALALAQDASAACRGRIQVRAFQDA